MALNHWLLILFVFLGSCSKNGTISISPSAILQPVTINLSSFEIVEGNTAVVVLLLSQPASEDLILDWSISGTDAINEFPLTSGSATVFKNALSASSIIASNENTIYDLDRTYTLNVIIRGKSTSSSTPFLLKDNESLPTVQFLTTSQNALENAVSPSVTVSISQASKFPISVSYSIAGSATPGVDHLLSTGTLNLQPLTTSAPLPLLFVDDALFEGPETLQVTMTGVSGGAVLGTNLVHEANIIDNETTSLFIDDVAVTEGGAATFTVSLSTTSAGPVTFDWTTSDGTGNSTTDYFSASGTTVTITPPATSTTLTVNTRNDTNPCELAKTFNISLSNPTGASLSDGTGVGTINDNDQPTVEFSSATSSIAEGTGSNNTINAVVSLSAACPTQSITVQAASSNGTATAGSDYTALGLTTFTIPANSTSVNVPVSTIADALFETDETLTLTLSNPTLSSIGTQSTHVVTLTNDDAKPTLSIANVSVTEGSTATLTVTQSAQSGVATTVVFDTSNGTATTVDSDYTAVTATTLTIPAGSTSVTRTVATGNDTKDELDETVTITLSGGNGNYDAAGSTLSSILTITDNDDPPTISLSTPTAVSEGATLIFTATLSAVSGKTVTTDFNSSNNSATAGTDYTAVSSTLTFNPGTTTQTINVVTTDDASNCESTETLTGTLSNFANVTAGSPVSTTGTVLENDVPQLSLNTPAAANEGSTFSFTLTSNMICPTDITTTYATRDHVAQTGSDFVYEEGSLTIPSGSTTATFDIASINDSTHEPTETFFVRLSPPNLGALTSGGSVITLLDNDASGSPVTAKVEMGPKHSCALSTAGDVKCWGEHINGKLLTGDHYMGFRTGEMTGMQPINLGTGVQPTKIAVGLNHACAVLSNNKLKCWGNNSNGQLGQGDNIQRDSPQEMGDNLLPINLGTGLDVQDACAGASYTCALLNNDMVKCFGNGSGGILGDPTTSSLGDSASEMGDALPYINIAPLTVKKLSCGGSHACVLASDDTVRCWGSSSGGQLGRDSQAILTGNNSLPAVNLGSAVKVLEVATGDRSSCALLEDQNDSNKKKIKCWGANTNGLLGLGHSSNVGDAPVLVSTMPDVFASEMGDNLPFLDFNTPADEPLKIWLGNTVGCAQFTSGNVKCWGKSIDNGTPLTYGDDNSNDPDGAGPLTELASVPVVDFGVGLTILNMSTIHSAVCGLVTDGVSKSMRCFGRNYYGLLGVEAALNVTRTPATATPVLFPPGRTAHELNSHPGSYTANCALMDNSGTKEAMCWGVSTLGHLGNGLDVVGDDLSEMGAGLIAASPGNGTSGNPFVPKDIALGPDHTCVLSTEGEVRCLGDNAQKQLGNSASSSPYGDEPTELLSSQTIVSLGAGRQGISIIATDLNTCALLDNFTVKCWGDGSYGINGNGSVTDQFLPQAIDLGTNLFALSIKGGNSSVCALLNNDSVKCWGRNLTGSLGIGLGNGVTIGAAANQMGDNLVAVNLGVDGSSNPYTARGLTSSGYASCAILNDGKAKCWGNNTWGQLGLDNIIGTGSNGASPTVAATPPIALSGTIISMKATIDHTCAVFSDFSMKCWGDNFFGQLGLSSTTQWGHIGTNSISSVPVLDFGVSVGARQVAMSTSAYLNAHWYSQTCAVLTNDEVKCWGNNHFGQLGLGDISPRSTLTNEHPYQLSPVDLSW